MYMTICFSAKSDHFTTPLQIYNIHNRDLNKLAIIGNSTNLDIRGFATKKIQ